MYADELDRAAHLMEIANETAVDDVRRRAAPKQIRNADGTWPDPDCLRCGEPIGSKRLEVTGSNMCVDCANRTERLGKQYAAKS